MNSLLMWIGALLAAVLAALFAVPHFVDWNLYRGQFEAEASRMLGREVRVSGSVAVDILPAPRMSFGRVRIADVPLDPSEPPGEPILRAERIELGLGISSLLRGDLDISRIEIVKPELRLSLNSSGRGNWQTLALRRDSLPLTTSEFKVGSVAVSGGKVMVAGPDGLDLMTFDGIDGDLDEVVGTGPLRFRGALDWRGERHELRLSTADAEPGALRLKAGLRAVVSGNTLSFDGALTELAKVPRVTGEVVARFAPPRPTVQAAAPAASTPAASTPGFELRARIDGNGRGAKLENVSLSFERDGQPQLVTGAVEIGWTEGLNVEASLESRWLDVDRMSGPAGTTRPLEGARAFTRVLDRLLPDKGRVNARIAVDQVTFGGDVMSSVAFDFRGQDGRLTIERLAASLPGGGHLAVSGTASADAANFDGRFQLRASSATRLLGWAAKGSTLPVPESDGPFIVEGVIAASDDTVIIDQVKAEVSGQPITGRLGYKTGPRPATSLQIDASQLDISGVLPGLLDLANAKSVLWQGALREGSPLARWLDPRTGDMTLRLRTGRLSDGTTVLSEVDADVELTAASTAVRRLRVVGGGLAIDMSGLVTASSGVERKGNLAWQVRADKPAGVQQLADVLGAPALGERAADLAPLRLAGLLTVPAADAAPTELTADGTARTTRLRIVARSSARQIDRWRGAPLEADIDVEGPDALTLAGLARARTPAAGLPSARLSVRLAGNPDKGLLAKAAIQTIGTSEFSAAFDGRLATGEADTAVTGKVDINLQDTAELMRLAGLPFAGSFRDLPIRGTLGVAQGKDGLLLALDRIAVAGARLSGTILRHPAGTIDADIVADRVALRALTAALTARPAASTPAAIVPAAIVAPAVPWPEEPFDLSAIKSEMRLKLAARRLEIATGAVVEDAALSASIGPGRVDITSLTATLLEGRLNATWSMRGGPAATSATGRIELADLDLATIPFARQRGKGRASLALDIEGKGYSPRSLVQSIGGKGALTVKGVQLPGLYPGAVVRAAQSYLAAEAPPDDAHLQALMRNALANNVLDIGDKVVPVAIENGALKVAQFRVTTADALLTNRSTLDLATFMADAEWRIEPRQADMGTKRRDALPPVSIVFSGSAWELARTEPRVATDDLGRELTVRLMERDVDELERLRRLDEERSREEAIRRKAVEEARAAEALARAAARVEIKPDLFDGEPVSEPAPPSAAAVPAEPPPPPPTPRPAPRPQARESAQQWWGLKFLYPPN